MEYPSLFRLYPSYFRIIGLSLSALFVLLALLLKFSQMENVLFLDSKATLIFLLFSLLICIMSKDNNEDERSDYLRLKVYFSGFVGLVYLIIGNELLRHYNGPAEQMDILFITTMCTAYLVLYFELLKKSTIIDWLERRTFLNSVITVVLLFFLFRFGEWLWGK